MHHLDIYEASHFFGDADWGDDENFTLLIESIEDGLLRPDNAVAWAADAGLLPATDEVAPLQAYVSFIEPTEESFLQHPGTSHYGLGFSPDILASHAGVLPSYSTPDTSRPLCEDQMDALFAELDSMQACRLGKEITPGGMRKQPTREWRSYAPLAFTLDDVQSIYVATCEEVITLRIMFPRYHGAIVVL